MSLVPPGVGRRDVKTSSARNRIRKKICEILRKTGNLERATNSSTRRVRERQLYMENDSFPDPYGTVIHITDSC